MSISAIKRFRTVLVYLSVAALAVIVNRVYAFFGHGVSSGYMTWMFLYPLLGGAFFFVIINLLLPYATSCRGYRLFCNLYHSGIALLTVASLMKGIFAIAGTDSSYVAWYDTAGCLFLSMGLITLATVLLRHHKSRTNDAHKHSSPKQPN